MSLRERRQAVESEAKAESTNENAAAAEERGGPQFEFPSEAMESSFEIDRVAHQNFRSIPFQPIPKAVTHTIRSGLS